MNEKFIKDIIFSLLRGTFAFITYLLFIGIANFFLYICVSLVPSFFSVTINSYITLSFAILVLFAYYNIICSYAVFSKNNYSYLNDDNKKYNIVKILKTPFFWLEYSPKLFFLIITPSSLFFSILFSFFTEININVNNAIFSAAFKILSIVLSFGLEVLAIKKAQKSQKTFFKKLKHTLRYVIMYPITCTLLLVVLFAIYNMVFVSQSGGAFIKIFLIIIGIIIFAEISNHLRALRVRRKFYKNLKKICDEKNARLSELYRPYLSIFNLGDKQSFSLEYNGKIYTCQMIAIKRKGDPVYISQTGELEIKHTMFLGKYGPLSKILKDNLTYVTSLNFGWENTEPNTRKILIIAPVSSKMFAGTVGRNTPIDVGEKIGTYTVYNGKGFINAIDRDCIM